MLYDGSAMLQLHCHTLFMNGKSANGCSESKISSGKTKLGFEKVLLLVGRLKMKLASKSQSDVVSFVRKEDVAVGNLSLHHLQVDKVLAVRMTMA